MVGVHAGEGVHVLCLWRVGGHPRWFGVLCLASVAGLLVLAAAVVCSSGCGWVVWGDFQMTAQVEGGVGLTQLEQVGWPMA